MPPKEKAVVIALGTAIVGAIAYLAFHAPIGSFGSADGQSYDVDRFLLIGYLLFLLAAGYFVMRRQNRPQAKIEVQEVEPDETVWPPPPSQP